MNYKVEMCADGTIRIGASDAAELFSFVQLSDSHLQVPRADLPWTGERVEAMLEVVRRANALQPDFIAFTGDMLDSFTPENLGYIKDLFARFKAPVYFVLGNHDPGIRSIAALRNLVDLEADFVAERERIGALRRHNVEVPREASLKDDECGMLQSSPRISSYACRRWARAFELEELSYSLEVAGFHLVFFNFDRAGIEEDEMAWLEADIKKSRARPTLLFFHVPLPVEALVAEIVGELGRDSCLAAGPNTERLFSLLAENPQIAAAFCGHVHFDSMHYYENCAQITTAPVFTGACRRVVVRGPG